jgi:hypothetical protein
MNMVVTWGGGVDRMNKMLEAIQAKVEQVCDTFILTHQVEQVYYLPYPYQKLSACWVVHKVNPHKRLHTPGDGDP